MLYIGRYVVNPQAHPLEVAVGNERRGLSRLREDGRGGGHSLAARRSHLITTRHTPESSRSSGLIRSKIHAALLLLLIPDI